MEVVGFHPFHLALFGLVAFGLGWVAGWIAKAENDDDDEDDDPEFGLGI